MALLTKFLGKTTLFTTTPPHTHSWDSSPFTEAQRTQPSQFNHRTHPQYGRTRIYVFMALLMTFLGKKPLFSPHHRPHTHSWDSSHFTEAQKTQPSQFDHRIHPQYGRTRIYVFMALLTKFLGKKHSFHRITAPTHILGTPPLSLRYNEPNPVCSTTGHTPYMDGQDSTSLWLY